MPFRSISAAVAAVIAIGTVCRLSERRCAVTVTSSSTELSVGLVSAASSGAAAQIKPINGKTVIFIAPPSFVHAQGGYRCHCNQRHPQNCGWQGVRSSANQAHQGSPISDAEF